MKKLLAILLVLLLAGMCAACSRESAGPADAAGTEQTEQAEQAPPERKGTSASGAALDAAFDAGHVVFEAKAFAKPDPETCSIAAPPEEAWGIIRGIRPKKNADQDETKKTETTIEVSRPGSAIKKSGSEASPAPSPAPVPMDEPAIRGMLAKGELTIYSYAPDGKHGAGFLSADGITVPVAVSENSLAVIYPSQTRGVEDVYGLEEAYYLRCWRAPDTSMMFGMGTEGLIWSQDGRYCCGLNGEMYRKTQTMRTGVIPAVVDTQTGEMFLLDAYSNYPPDKDSGCVTEGFFSDDGQYFYGVYYGAGHMPEGMGRGYALIRYNLATYEAEIIRYLVSDMQSAAMLPDQRFLMLSVRLLNDSGRTGESSYSTTLSYTGTGSNSETLIIPLLGHAGDHGLVYSPASDTGLLLTSSRTIDLYRGMESLTAENPAARQRIGMSALTVIDPSKSLAENMNILWMVFGQPDHPRISGLDAKQFGTIKDTREYFFPSAGNDPEAAAEGSERPWTFLEAVFSPDGRYAAVAAAFRQETPTEIEAAVRLLIVRLSDMRMIAAEGLEEYAGANIGAIYQAEEYATLHNLLNWSEAGLLIRYGSGDPLLWQLKGLN